MQDQALLTELLIKDFDIHRTELPANSDYEDVLIALQRVINHLLNNDFERLLLALYRIDIDEQKVKRILSEVPPNEISSMIAELVITRELQKIASRKKYKG